MEGMGSKLLEYYCWVNCNYGRDRSIDININMFPGTS
jgi:hypothetical protein